MDATLAEVAAAGRGADSPLPDSLKGRVSMSRIGLLGHSRGGFNAGRYSRHHPAVRSLFLLAPFFQRQPVPDVPMTVALGTCDGDTGIEGRHYYNRATKADGRTTRAVQLTVTGANHDAYNRTLVRLGIDDADTSNPKCTVSARPTAAQQQAWASRAVVDHFRATLVKPRERASYLRRSGPDVTRLAGLPTRIQRFFP